MFSVKRPSIDKIHDYLASQREQPFSYSAVGDTNGESPKGFSSDRHSVRLGHGRETFQRAKEAIREWAMFPEQMATLCWPNAPIENGTTVAALFRAGPLWTLNPCRIVYTFDEVDDVERFGFAYGTLPDHLECGEERFSVEWRRADDSVWYELYCFSRPQHWLSWIGFPYVRWQQARFRRLSGEAIQQACGLVANDSKGTARCATSM